MRISEIGKTFSDVISYEEISKWDGNVILEGGTGTGKTHLILNTFQQYTFDKGLKILFLCNRTALAEEVRADITDNGILNIDVDTYQNIEDAIKNKIIINKKYDWVVCDEFHHVLEVYNVYTDLSLEWIMNHAAKKLFMSATCSGLFNLLIKDGKVHTDNHYFIPKDYSYVDKLYFYTRKDAYLDIIKDKLDNTNDKIIYFTQSMEQAIELYEMYRDVATFYCSSWTKNHKAKKLLKENEGNLHSETFEGRLLITTTALDVGISLKDYSIKHIICNIYDYSQLIQCLGRKRKITERDEQWIEGQEDTCTFYIRNYTKRELNMYRNTKILEEMNLFKLDREAFNHTYLNDREYHNKYIPYNNDIKDYEINKIAQLKFTSNECDLDYMTKNKWFDGYGNEHSGVGYKHFIIKKLNCPRGIVEDYETYEDQQKKVDLVTYLMSIVEKPLYKDDRNKLKEVFNKNGLKARTMGINTLNGNLKDRNLPYKITSKRSNKSRWWEVDSNINWKEENI